MKYKGCWITNEYRHDGTFAIYGFDHLVADGFESEQQAKDYLDAHAS